MLKVNVKVKLAELDRQKLSEEQALASMRKYLKSSPGEAYQTKGNILAQIMDRNSKNVTLIAETKLTQWRIVNYSILLFAAIAGSIRLITPLSLLVGYKICLSIGAAVIMTLAFYVARKMMDKVNEDFDLYRQHSKLNEEMLCLTVGMPAVAIAVVSARRPDLAPKHDFSQSAQQNRAVFSDWLDRIIAGSGIVALVVAQLIVWLN
jgi:hypothetical protein